MQARELQAAAIARANELPGSQLTHPFGDEWDVYKVREKIFMLMTEITGEALVTLKSDPIESEALRADHQDITPGYHMNKRHWITLHAGGQLTGDEVAELVTESYCLVVAQLPKAMRPVDPWAFGKTTT